MYPYPPGSGSSVNESEQFQYLLKLLQVSEEDPLELSVNEELNLLDYQEDHIPPISIRLKPPTASLDGNGSSPHSLNK